MGWGFLQGLGQGLTQTAKLPQQYYENVEQAKLDKSRLELEAMQLALAEQNKRFAAENHPLEMEHMGAQTAAEKARTDEARTARAIATRQALEGMTPDEVALKIINEGGAGSGIQPGGVVPINPKTASGIATDKAQAAAAYASANHANQLAKLVVPAQAGLYNAEAAQTKYFTEHPEDRWAGVHGRGAAGGDPASVILRDANQYMKYAMDSSKYDIMGAVDLKAKMGIIGGLRQQALASAIAAYEQIHGKLDPASKAKLEANVGAVTGEAATGELSAPNPAVLGALDPNGNYSPRF